GTHLSINRDCVPKQPRPSDGRREAAELAAIGLSPGWISLTPLSSAPRLNRDCSHAGQGPKQVHHVSSLGCQIVKLIEGEHCRGIGTLCIDRFTHAGDIHSIGYLAQLQLNSSQGNSFTDG